MAAVTDLSEWDNDPRLFLFTSLSSGSSRIFSATSRLETILKANKIPFQAIDVATDEKARKLWGRRAGKKTLPGLVKEGLVIADFEQVEEWNEFGELNEAIGPVPATANASTKAPAAATSSTNTQKTDPAPSSNAAPPANDPMRDLATQAASIGLNRAKGPQPGVDASKIRPLPGAAPLQPKEASQPEAAPSSEVPNTDKAVSNQAGNTKPPEVEAVEKYIARDPTDPVPSAGTPLSSVHPGRTPDVSEPISTVDSSDSLAGGQGGIVEPSKETAAMESTSSLQRATSSASSSSQPAGSRSLSHRGSEIKLASQEEIKGVEDEQRIEEAANESEDDKLVQKAADASKAGKSVQD